MGGGGYLWDLYWAVIGLGWGGALFCEDKIWGVGDDREGGGWSWGGPVIGEASCARLVVGGWELSEPGTLPGVTIPALE